MLPQKKWYTWTVLLRLVFLDNEYPSEFFQTFLAVPHFSNIAPKNQKQSPMGVLEKRCFWKFCKPKFSCEFCKNLKNNFFHRTPPAAASEKLNAETVDWRGSVKKVFLEILLNSQENLCQSLFYSLRNATLLK